MVKIISNFFILIVVIAFGCSKKVSNNQTPPVPTITAKAEAWITNPDRSYLFKKESVPLPFVAAGTSNQLIDIDEEQSFQTMEGFGYTLTGGSAMLINKMPAAQRAALLKNLFATDEEHIGISYLRVSIGASDLDEQVFSYNDLPAGQTDPELTKFSLDPDRTHLIPVLKEILAIYPAMKILGSPWSPPTWMKTNDSTKGGSLKPDYYDAYAKYFVKYIRGMKAEGITIDAITIQNEPLHPGNNPSLLMLAPEQATFIKNHLGPQFAANNITTKIILYDHNADRPDYPISILNDPEAKKYVAGSAFHLYGGNIEALSTVHNAHPDKKIYFTEQWIGAPGNFAGDFAWHMKTLLIGAPRNWAVNVLEWNLAADPNQKPHTPGGCTQCLGALTIDGGNVTKNTAYYVIAHASKFVRPGSVRITSNVPPGLPNVAFKNTEGKTVVIVFNDSNSDQTFNIKHKGLYLPATLKKGAAGTYIW